MVSALGMGPPSQLFQNRDPADISKALRLPIRVRNMAMAALATTTVGMRGSTLRPVMAASTSSSDQKTFSE